MKQQLNVKVDRDLLSQFKEKCIIDGLKMSAVIESMIYTFLKNGIYNSDE